MVRSSQRLRWHLSEFERPDHTVLTTSDAWETDIESQGHEINQRIAHDVLELALEVARLMLHQVLAVRPGIIVPLIRGSIITVTTCPASTRWRAIGSPIAPRPTKPTFTSAPRSRVPGADGTIAPS